MNRQLLAQELLRDEGLRLKPYRCTAGALTIGVGRNLDARGITEAEARFMLANDMEDVWRGVVQALPWVDAADRYPPAGDCKLGISAWHQRPAAVQEPHCR
jgi:lysozyme